MSKKFLLPFLFLAAGGLFLAYQSPAVNKFFNPVKPPILKVIFFDVGQGDSSLIITPTGQTILVDGGEGTTVLNNLGRPLPFYQKKIDYIILTHPHADHLEGLVAVLKKYEVGQVIYTGLPHTTNAFLEWLKLIKEKKISMKIIKGVEMIELDSGVKLNFLYPNRDLSLGSKLENVGAGSVLPLEEAGTGSTSSPPDKGEIERGSEESKYQKENSLNNTSIVFKLIYGQISFLFMGDAETPVEEELLRCKRGGKNCPLLTKEGIKGWLKSDVLKVAHHGSHSSTSEAFLEAVQPQIAVISVGKNNDFGHPHLRTLRRLERFGVKILRTDEMGDVELESDGDKIKRH